MNYDTLNRLSGATASSGPWGPADGEPGLSLSWMYDPFGNREIQTPSGAPHATVPQALPLGFTGNKNQIDNYGPSGYDPAGNVLNDLTNQYAYDGEGRICVVYNPYSGYTQYIYDGEGRRVAKGTITSLSCNTNNNGFAPTESYLLGLSGEQISELDGSGNFLRSHVYANGQLLATYANGGTEFALGDWLGTKRVVAKADGSVAGTCINLPFGDELTCTGSASLSGHHFTGQLHDQESNNDYFGARYYAEYTGRFLSPEYSMYGVIMELPQSWNKYSYVINRPLFASDPDGRCPWCVGAIVGGVVEGGFDLGKQLYNNGGSLSKVSWGEVGANTVGGAVAGALAVATGGASLVESAVVGDIAAGGTANVVGGAVTRALDPNTKSDDVLSAGEISQDAVAGFVGGGAGHLAGDFVHVPDEPIHNGRASTGAIRRDNAKFAKYNNALANQITRATVAGSAATHTTNGGFSLFNWFFNQPPPPPPCATTSATDSRGNGTGLSGCQ
jgi:RHS repeat-associated protein